MLLHPGNRISNYEVAQLFGSAYIRTDTMKKSVRGFECTGLWPFNPKIFNDDDYASSLVTDDPPLDELYVDLPNEDWMQCIAR